MQAGVPISPNRRKLEQLNNPNYPMCRDDVIWILDLIRKKVAEEEPRLLELSQPQLLRQYQNFAEVAMCIIHKQYACNGQIDALKQWLLDA